MNPLDLIIIATMVFFIVRGVFRGFFREIGSRIDLFRTDECGYEGKTPGVDMKHRCQGHVDVV